MNRFVVSAAAGLAGGALGLVAMRYAMQGSNKALEKLRGDVDGQHQAESSESNEVSSGEPGHDDEYMSLTGFRAREGETATGALARVVYERVTGRELSEEAQAGASEWVHRGYGETVALGYALLATGRGWGITGGVAYGFLLWLLGDELMVPLLGLAKKPTEYPPETHVAPFLGHLAFGAALGAAVSSAERLVH
jgi:hypothetical protein